MLVIVKQMLIEGKATFKDFTESDEAIATNILSAKLKLLEELGIILKTQRPNNRKVNLYLLTEKGLALTPILLELAAWSDKHLREIHPKLLKGLDMELRGSDKSKLAERLDNAYREKRAEILRDAI